MPDYLKEAFDYYREHHDSFVRLYNGKVIVLKDRVVLGAYDEEIDAINETMKKEPLGTFLVQKVTPGSEAYTVTIHRAVFP
jgi:hypothetical protein